MCEKLKSGMSYPCVRCLICRNRIQLAVYCAPGELPSLSYLSKEAVFSSLFDDESAFAQHCRGQGTLYNERRPASSPYGERATFHYNFTGCFSGMCCFCALKSGFVAEVFGEMGCYDCVRKERLRAEVARAFRSSGVNHASASWSSHGWSALPLAIVDHILVFVAGLEACADQAVIVRDGEVEIVCV